MNKTFLFLLIYLSLFTSFVCSQDSKPVIPATKNDNPYQYGSIYYVTNSTSTPYFKLEKDDAAEIKDYLLKTFTELKQKGNGLKLIFNKKSPGGNHFTYQQTYFDIPVYASTIKVNTDKNLRIVSVFKSCLPVALLDEQVIRSQVVKLNQKKFVQKFIQLHFDGSDAHENEISICFTDETHGQAVQKITVWNRGKELNVLNLVDENGTLLFQKDLNAYFTAIPQDSLINIKIFNPDPLTVAGVSYGIPYKDNSDVNALVLDTVRFDTTVIATFDTGTFTLKNNFVSVQDFDSPNKAVVTQTNPDFFYNRFDDGFEDVNAFYHVTTMQNYIQAAGFTNLMNQVLEIDTHGAQGSDNSFFTGTGAIPNITMGEGGVDDAEDADVIVHEYGHAISWSANNNNFTSTDRGALDEAFGDYQAATYSRAINSFHWFEVFTWDGHNEFWDGRYANTTKTYPASLTGWIHDDGEIWSSVMMEIWGLLGKSVTDKLQYEALYGYSDNMSMPDAALLVIQADSSLNGGANFPTLCDRFAARGLYGGSCVVSVPEENVQNRMPLYLNTNGFASGSTDMKIIFPSVETRIELQVFDVIGRKILSQSYSGSNGVSLKPDELGIGLYEVVLTTSSGKFSSKVVRLN